MKKLLTVLAVIALIAAAVNAEKNREQEIKKLETQLETVSGTEQVDVLNQLASSLYIYEPKRCLQYCSRALELSGQLKYPGGRAQALIYKSYALSVRGEREKNLENVKEALTIFEKLGDQKGIADASGAIGYFYLQKNYTNIALEYFLNALQVYEKLDDKKGFIKSYWNLGNLYLHLKEYKKSLDYFQHGLKVVEETGDERKKAPYFHNIGLTYHNLGDFHRAIENFQKALTIFETTGQDYWTAATLLNMGVTLLKVNRNKKALNYFFKSLRINEETGNKEGMYYDFKNIGYVYMMKKDYNQAAVYYDRAFAIAKEINDDSILESIYKGYSDLFAARGDYKKAFEYHRLYTKTKDVLINMTKNKQIAELQEKYEIEKKIKEIEILKKNSSIQAITRNALVSIVILTMIIIVLLFKRYLYLFAFWKKQKYIGQYRIMETIDSGGMGTVYLAHNLRDKYETAAVKVLREELFKDEISRKRFKYEGTIIDSLTHPNIVRIYERGECKGKLYIAMELLQGKTLAQTIEEEGQLALNRCLSSMTQLADVLEFIHGKSIVHRDLKPANIMLTGENNTGEIVKLLDFGLARRRFQTRLTQTGMLVGTINYMSPEQVSGLPSSTASDVYALGIIFYEMVTGRHAFPGDTITGIVDKIHASTPDEPKQYRPDISSDLNRLIMQMLSKEAKLRPSAAAVLQTLNTLPSTRSSYANKK